MATQHERQQQQPLHILFLPFFAPGHLLPAADVAAVFAARGARCTILTTPVNAGIIRPAVDRANGANNLHGTGSGKIDIALMPFPDVGLPPGVENYMSLTTLQADCRAKFMRAVQLVQEPFHRFLAANRLDAVVSDSFFSWSADAAVEHGIPRLVITGTSVFARSCNASMLRSNPLEMTSEGDPEALVMLPGLPHRVELRRSQMMDPGKQPGAWAFYQSNNAADQSSFGEVFNSFHELEPDYVEHFQTTLGRHAFLVGPVALATWDMAASGANVNADVNKDRCLRWLDTKPDSSVVYVSFGTATRFSPVELREISRGLDLSGKNFVWALGDGAGTESSEWMPEGFAKLTANIGDSRGCIIRGWAPQTLILNHHALGGFMTHCGWNSVMEAVSAGVPMVTWPRYADQFYNEKLVVEVLKVGVSVGARDYASPMENHEVIGGEVIAESIMALMGNNEQGDAIRKKTNELGVKARSAMEKGGSSYSDVGRLMDELMARRRCSIDFRAAGGV
ncbi:UDP-glucose flavonoid 3-O-glucosyltransferase 7-like [Lolium rigidum]|uniref:UDP-glucose flavonoid 3-O-glucosyltransferase 7-like n=1 Tax=Lolium rigidum TaxID=89674 RepID=UPI001F5D1AA2|nr:UDP-glucose flavonoid 3-O-glucosyltransferase 7-like [Lolium rigidum]